MASPSAVTASHSLFSAVSPGHAKRAVFKHLAETPRLARVTAASHLEIRPAPETVSFGILELDTFTGGLPRGSLSEIVGPDSSGRTSILLAALAAATKRGEICALIDSADSFDPRSAAAAGVDLSRLLWVRCTKQSSPDNPVQSSASKPDVETSTRVQRNISSTRKAEASSPLHTRSMRPSRQLRESRDGYATAPTYRGAPEPSGLRSLFQPASPQPLHSPIKGTRNKSAIQTNELSSAEESQSDISQESASREDARTRWKRLKMEDPVERALRATDLLLQSGGFGLVAIDLAGVPAKTARRVPLTTWFRFRRVIEGTPTIMLLIGEQPCAQTCASLGLKLAGQERSLSEESSVVGRWSSAKRFPSGRVRLSTVGRGARAHTHLLEGLHLQAEILRARTDRKPMQSVTHFPSKAAWTG